MKIARVCAAGLAIAAMAAAVGWWLECEAGAALQDEIAVARQESRELARLRAENVRLAARQPSAAELDRLRSDHAAVVRLRSEMEAVRANVEKREKAVAARRAE